GKFEQPQFRMILQFSSRRQILRKAPGRSILRREVASKHILIRQQRFWQIIFQNQCLKETAWRGISLAPPLTRGAVTFTAEELIYVFPTFRTCRCLACDDARRNPRY